jgi:hypothetical protein
MWISEVEVRDPAPACAYLFTDAVERAEAVETTAVVAVDTGDPYAGERLWLERAARSGNPGGILGFGSLLEERGRFRSCPGVVSPGY